MTFGTFAVIAAIFITLLLWMNRGRLSGIKWPGVNTPKLGWVSKLHLNTVFLGIVGFVLIHWSLYRLWPVEWNKWSSQDGFWFWQFVFLFALWMRTNRKKSLVYIGHILLFLSIMGVGGTIRGALNVQTTSGSMFSWDNLGKKIESKIKEQMAPEVKYEAPVAPEWVTVPFYEGYKANFSWPNDATIRIAVTRWTGKNQERVLLPEENPVTVKGSEDFKAGQRIDHIRIQSASKEAVPVSFDWRKK